MKRFLLGWTVLLCLLGVAAGQGSEAQGNTGQMNTGPVNNSARLHRGMQEIGLWASYSPTSVIGIGKSEDRRYFEMSGQYAITVLGGQHMALKWVSELVPVALLHEPTEYYFNSKHQLIGERVGGTTYGAGATPLGLQWNFLNGHRVQPFVDAHGGMLYFTRQEPVPNSSQFNFTFNFGTGVQIFAGEKSRVLVGFKYHHISNNETAPQNPGIDNLAVYAGWLWRLR